MATTPAGQISEPLNALRTLIGTCPAFISWVGELTAALAMNHIYFFAVPVEADDDTRPEATANIQEKRPFCILGFPESDAYRSATIADGATQTWDQGGTFTAMFQDNVASADYDDWREAFMKFANNLGETIEDMTELSKTPNFLVLREIRLVIGPERAGFDEQMPNASGDHFAAMLAIDWGGEL